jgi:cytochrome c biogenesis factor
MAAVVVRPYLWATAIGAWFAFTPLGWWKRWPFLPIPDRSVVDWRVTTAYGQPDMTLATNDMLSYLQWRRQQDR